jgi:hypothetical protein
MASRQTPENPPRSSPTSTNHPPEGAHHIRPIHQIRQAGATLRDVRRWFLSYSSSSCLPDPRPSGSAGYDPALSGLLPPIPSTSLGPAALSYTALPRQGQRWWSLTPTRTSSASRRTLGVLHRVTLVIGVLTFGLGEAAVLIGSSEALLAAFVAGNVVTWALAELIHTGSMEGTVRARQVPHHR